MVTQIESRIASLLRAVENQFPHPTVGDDKWYLVAISTLAFIDPALVGTLYTYLIPKPEYSTSEARKALVRRLREALVKVTSVVGVCKPILAIYAISELEHPDDRDLSFSRENWSSGLENRARGEAWLNVIYKENLETATGPFAAHQDFDFISKEITYGFYLSDHTILGPVETELVILSGIMIQNLHSLTAWHLRGTRRVGVSSEDVESIQQCIEMIAAFGKISLDKIPRVADIEHQV